MLLQSTKISILTLALTVVLSSVSRAEAKYARVETEQVPVERLLTNLNKKLSEEGVSNKDKANLEFQIGRLHSMAYALKSESATVLKGEVEPTVPFYGHGTSEGHQFIVTPPRDQQQITSAKQHLKEAITHLRKSLSLDPSQQAVKLGLAWCLDQDGQRAQAVTLYREVFKATWGSESKQDTGMAGTSIASEALLYLTRRLDPVKDATELTDLQSKENQLSKIYRAVTPIVVPLAPDVEASQLMQPASVAFDLDGTGPRNYSCWPAAGKAAWLVYDADNCGSIRSGLQLFGAKTFWIFWHDGYEAMSALDDNRDGQLTGNELSRLALWEDRNRDGISQPSEVRPLAEYGITALSCRSALAANGMLSSKAGVTFADGSTADSYDWLVPGGPLDAAH